MINKYEDFLEKIMEYTESSKITWVVAEYRDYGDHIVNGDDILKSFKTEIKDMEIVLLDTREQRYFGDFDSYVPVRNIVMLLIKNNILAKVITDSIVKQDLLYELLELVAEKLTKIDEDIDSFLEDT